MINVQVEKGPNENNTSIIRKFTRRVQDSGVLNRVRGLRYYERSASTYVQKKKTLKKITQKEETDKLIKLGKMKVFTRR